MSKSRSLVRVLKSASGRALEHRRGARLVLPVVLSTCAAIALAWPGISSVIPKTGERECKKFLTKGDHYYGTGAYHASLSFYQQAVTSEPASFEAHLKLGLTLARLGSNDEALKELFQSLLLNADHPETNLTARAEIAAILMKQGNYDEAGGQLKQVLDLSPNDTAVRGNYALCLKHLGFVDAAIEQLKLIVKANPYDTVVLYNLGASYLRKSDGEAAKRYFERVISIDSKHVLSYLGLAKATMLGGDNQTALRYCRSALELAPENHYAYLAMGDIFEKLQDKPKAVEAYKRAIQLSPRDSASRAALAKLLEASRSVASGGHLRATQ